MTHAITDAVLALWTSNRKTKTTPSGWISGNAVCCQYNNNSLDKRNRGGLLINPSGGFSWHCFNCNFKTSWNPGVLITKNNKNFFKWLGMTDDEINKLSLSALQLKTDNDFSLTKFNFSFEEKSLPENTNNILTWIIQDNSEEIQNRLIDIVQYLNDRGMELDWYPWHWSNSTAYKDRLLIPFYHDKKIVGWTARKIVDGKPKYLTTSQPGYVFNLDNQGPDRKYTILVEGPMDAIAIDGIAILHNKPNEIQCTRINTLNKEIIVVPDRDKAGLTLIDTALNNNWAVSLPPWELHIKDVADAVKHYGRIYTLTTILNSKETNTLKIQLLKKKLEKQYA